MLLVPLQGNKTTRCSALQGNVSHRLPVIENSFARGVVQIGNSSTLTTVTVKN